jgi:hypothetical protein
VAPSDAGTGRLGTEASGARRERTSSWPRSRRAQDGGLAERWPALARVARGAGSAQAEAGTGEVRVDTWARGHELAHGGEQSRDGSGLAGAGAWAPSECNSCGAREREQELGGTGGMDARE